MNDDSRPASPLPTGLSIESCSARVTFCRNMSVVEVSMEASSGAGDLCDGGGFLAALNRQLNLKRFDLSHRKCWALVIDQWGYPTAYLFWRVFWAKYHLGWSVYDWIDNTLNNERPATWLIYLTNWTYFLLLLDTIGQAFLVSFIMYRKPEMEVHVTPLYLKMAWLVYETVSTASIMVTLLYFIFLYDGSMTLLSMAKHVFNSVYVLLDLGVTATPVRLMHFIYPAGYAVVYLCFTSFYWGVGGVNMDGEPYIYKVLDWSDPAQASLLGLSCVFGGVPAVHFLLWCLYMLRKTVYGQCVQTGPPPPLNVEQNRVQRTLSAPLSTVTVIE
ncbi:hypothetical protein BaRGS_00018169 [Batillaria attramentaria]|uniref:Protein rolling stone-like n=1 Tax=Batillaria attramentaria TaxID=370345 RepID=A0ABD0KU66_9CAEN